MEEAEWWAQDTAEGRSLHRQLLKCTDTLSPSFLRGCNCKCQSQSLQASDLYTAPLCFPNKSEAPNSGNPVPKARHPKAHLSQATGRQKKGLLPRANTSAHLRLGGFLENNCYGFCLSALKPNFLLLVLLLQTSDTDLQDLFFWLCLRNNLKASQHGAVTDEKMMTGGDSLPWRPPSLAHLSTVVSVCSEGEARRGAVCSSSQYHKLDLGQVSGP